MGEISEPSGNVFRLLLEAGESPERGTQAHAAAHRALWCRWLALPVQEQIQYIDEVLCQTADPAPFAIADLYDKVISAQFVPALATCDERSLFNVNFEAAMWLIRERRTDYAAATGTHHPQVA